MNVNEKIIVRKFDYPKKKVRLFRTMTQQKKEN